MSGPPFGLPRHRGATYFSVTAVAALTFHVPAISGGTLAWEQADYPRSVLVPPTQVHIGRRSGGLPSCWWLTCQSLQARRCGAAPGPWTRRGRAGRGASCWSCGRWPSRPVPPATSAGQSHRRGSVRYHLTNTFSHLLSNLITCRTVPHCATSWLWMASHPFSVKARNGDSASVSPPATISSIAPSPVEYRG